MPRRLCSKLIYISLRLVVAAVRALPDPIAHRLGQAVGLAGFVLLRKLRRIALHNLRLAYGDEKTPAERRAIALTSAMNMGQNLVDFCRIPRLFRRDPRSFVEIEGLENLEEALAQGKGAILLTAHLGSWELMAATAAALGYPLTALVSSIGNSAVDEFMKTVRESCGYETLPKREASRGVASRLSHNILVGILSDLSPRSDAVPVKFFGKTAGATRGPAVFAVRTGAPVIPAFTVRLKKATKHRLIIEKPLKLIRTGDIGEDIARNTQLFQSVIERYVRRYPEQWLWMQKRWKVRSYLRRQIEKMQQKAETPLATETREALSGDAHPTTPSC